MKEINILCVEDGSVDVERLEEEGLHDRKVLIYRQGANPPFVLKLKTDDEQLKSEQNKVAVDKLEELQSWAELKEMDKKSYNKFRADYSVLELEEKFKSEVRDD